MGKKRTQLKPTSDDTSDSTYQFVGSPMKPLKRGYFVENHVIDNVSHCEGFPLKPAKYGQPGWDATCSKCSRLIQIKSSNQNCGHTIVATPASLPILEKQKITYYNVHCKTNGEMWIRKISPQKVKGKYYEQLSDDPWGNHRLRPLSGKITKPTRLAGSVPTSTTLSPQKRRVQLERQAKKKLTFE